MERLNNYIRLNNEYFEVEEGNCYLRPIQENKFALTLQIKTKQKESNFEKWKPMIYNGEPIILEISSIEELKGKTIPLKDGNPEWWTLYVYNHEDIISGAIEIINIEKNTVNLKWSGIVKMFYDENFNKSTSFECVCSCNLLSSNPPII